MAPEGKPPHAVCMPGGGRPVEEEEEVARGWRGETAAPVTPGWRRRCGGGGRAVEEEEEVARGWRGPGRGAGRRGEAAASGPGHVAWGGGGSRGAGSRGEGGGRAGARGGGGVWAGARRVGRGRRPGPGVGSRGEGGGRAGARGGGGVRAGARGRGVAAASGRAGARSRAGRRRRSGEEQWRRRRPGRRSGGGAAALDGVPGFRFAAIPDGLPPSDADATQDIPALCYSTMTTCLPHLLRR
ncbi:hypothetical protein EJB05_37056, partial [Eragrostis curvula]